MQVEVTDAAAFKTMLAIQQVDNHCTIAVCTAPYDNNCVCFSQTVSRIREAARIEGIRLGLEAAAGVADEWQSSLKPGSIDRLNGHREARKDIGTAIRAIDPAVIGAGQLPQRADSGR